MGSILIGDRVFESDFIVVYDVRSDSEEAPAIATAVLSKADPEDWKDFGPGGALAGLIAARAFRVFTERGEWPAKVARQS